MVRAYVELEKRHTIYSVPRSGYYVVERPGRRGGPAEGETIDFASSTPDPCVFPYLDFQHCLNKALDTYKYDLFTCADWNGLEPLRHALVSHLAGDQVFASAEQILLTPGVNRALEILAKMPFPNGNSTILVEQPSYDLYMRFLEAEGVPVRGIARTAAGIDLDRLETIFRQDGIKFFYTMPRHHSPLGTSYSVDERKAIARLAGKYHVYIVEDDYMADLGNNRGFDPIYAYDGTSHVVYLKSFSKIIFPGLRLGAAVLPDDLLKTYREYQRYADTSLLTQAALEVYIKSGMYERHRRDIGEQYAVRLRALNEVLRRHHAAGWLDVPDVRSGVYVPFRLPRTVNLERLVKRLAAHRILVVSGKSSYLKLYRDWEKFLRISISRVRPERIEEGVRRIVEEVRREVKSSA
jgi:DNA-binding transcriptional MocR family regulator